MAKTKKSKRPASSRDRLVKIPVSLYLDAPQAEALKALSDTTRVPQQVYLREGLDHVLKKYRGAK